jgi:hypothetical protein
MFEGRKDSLQPRKQIKRTFYRSGNEDFHASDRRLKMPKFVTIGYGDHAGYERTAPEVRDAAHEHDARLQAAGALMGIAGSPMQVRNPDGVEVKTVREAFMRSSLPVAGFAVIDAASMEEAVELVSKTPCAVAHGVVEVWPLETSSG